MARQMKDSGVEWIGEIPISWDISKVSYFYDIQLGKMLQPTQFSEDDTYEKYLCAANVGKNKLKLEGLKQMWFSPSEKKLLEIKKGDLLVVEGGDVASCDIITEDVERLYFQNALHRVRVRNDGDIRILKYFLWVAKSRGYIDLICNKATIAHFSKDKFLALPMMVIPLEEQHRIANYLDAQCDYIDSILEKNRVSIEEYKKLKQAVITQAVTKGVRGDKPMKESGIDAIGKIPQEWNTRKVKSFISIPVVDGPHESPNLYERGIPYISATAIENGKINFDLMRGFISEEYCDECDKRYHPKINDILVIKLGASTGQVAIVDTDRRFNIWVPLAAVRCDLSVNPRFIYYSFQSKSVIRQMELMWTFGIQQTLGVKTIEQLKFAVPSLDEQQEIVDYLDEKCAALDHLVSQKMEFTFELENYKKSMIYEYVTGKKEVSVC